MTTSRPPWGWTPEEVAQGGFHAPSDPDTITESTKGNLPMTANPMFELLYEKCREDHDLLAMIVDEYLTSLSDSKLTELEDFMVNNFGDD